MKVQVTNSSVMPTPSARLVSGTGLWRCLMIRRARVEVEIHG